MKNKTTNKMRTIYLILCLGVCAQIVFYSPFLLAAELFIYDAHGRKDPFSPPVIKATAESTKEIFLGIKLEGIIWDEDAPLAIINGKVVGLDAVIAGAKITKITQNEVVFDVNGEKVFIKLRKKAEEGL